jgi:hypothetical protein
VRIGAQSYSFREKSLMEMSEIGLGEYCKAALA